MIRLGAGVSLLLGLLGLAACSDTEAPGASATQGGAGTAPAGAAGQGGGGGAAGLAGTGGTAGTGPGGGAGATQSGPTITAATFTESATVPLAGTLSVSADRAVKVSVAIDDGQGHAFTLTTQESKGAHAIPVLQLRTARTYKLTVTVTDDAGLTASTVVDRVTAPLPADFPPIEVVKATAASAGLTLFGVGRWLVQSDTTWSYVVAVDSSGEVVWYLRSYIDISDVRLTSKGGMRLMAGENGIVEFTTLGEPLLGLLANALSTAAVPPGVTPVKLDTFHHDTVELPGGHLLSLTTTAKKVTKAECPTYDQDYTVVGDVVVEVDPATGEVVQRVSMFDLLDPCRRVDASFKSAFWVGLYGAGAADWTHANAVFYDQPNNRVLVSSRHQDWVVAYRYAADASGPAGELLFRFGVDGDFSLTAGDGALFPYHQHAAKIVSNGNLMVFDNGATRPGTLDTDITKLPRSRAVEYALTTTGPKTGWKATQVWEHGSKEVRLVDTSTGSPVDVPYYASVIGDADLTPASTVLMTTGALTSPANGLLFDPKVKKSARIAEFTHDAAQSVVMDLRIEDKATTGFTGYLVYRAERIATLYPASSGVAVTP